MTKIAAEITRDGFGREHALLVRPKGEGRFEILSGHHHRHHAAKRSGLATVPCWVRDMDDHEAFMQLVLSNAQGELSRWRRAATSTRFVQHGHVGGRRNKGGVREYALEVHKDEAALRGSLVPSPKRLNRHAATSATVPVIRTTPLVVS